MEILVLIAFLLGAFVFVSGFLFCRNALDSKTERETRGIKLAESGSSKMSERERVQWENILTYTGSGEGQTEVFEED